ncbi:MAG: RNA 2'-phosphotransferase [Lentisphaerota bacterium]
MRKELLRKSKFLSLVLRHDPSKIGIELDENGWTHVPTLIENSLTRAGIDLNRTELNEIVATNDKKRFSFSDDGLRIRASQGHSVKVDLGIDPSIPPEVLYHGTATHLRDDIMKSGLLKMDRQHVHLSKDVKTASKVGERHGKPMVFEVFSGEMVKNGMKFVKSDNDVWLTDHVPAEYLAVIKLN